MTNTPFGVNDGDPRTQVRQRAVSASAHSWTTGDYLTHGFNPELGIGRVTALEGRALVVEFPRSATTLRLAANTDALNPVDLSLAGRSGSPPPETKRRSLPDSRTERCTSPTGALRRPRVVAPGARRGAPRSPRPGRSRRDRRFRDPPGHPASPDPSRSRRPGPVSRRTRPAFPHQPHVAERASASDPVRWLLADEVGLGKTIEAALILNRLVHAGKVERCLVVAPVDTLTVQWLGELWRKYHAVFTLLDAQRLADVARDFGPDFNPFDVHRRAVIALEMLTDRPQLTDQAVAAGIDLLVVDEARRLRRPRATPASPAGGRSRGSRPGSSRAAPERDPPRRRRPRVLPSAPVSSSAGVSRRT